MDYQIENKTKEERYFHPICIDLNDDFVKAYKQMKFYMQLYPTRITRITAKLPNQMRQEVIRAYQENEEWIIEPNELYPEITQENTKQ